MFFQIDQIIEPNEAKKISVPLIGMETAMNQIAKPPKLFRSLSEVTT